MTGHEHNRSVAWVRLWGALGAAAELQRLVDAGAPPTQIEVAASYARFEQSRYAMACYALSTTANLESEM